MTIKFKPQARNNSQDINLSEKYYAAAIADGEVDRDTLAEQISYQCTVTESDCYTVLLSLERNIIDALKQRRIVKLGRLGNFQVGNSYEGSDTELEVDPTPLPKPVFYFA